MSALRDIVTKHLNQPASIAPLAVFRVLFGFMMVISVIRFAAMGWIYELYIRPDYYFTFYGFDWITPLGDPGMYMLFAVMGLAAMGVMLGLYYKASISVFFLTFTYVELIDKTNYLNHYYFVSIVAFLLILVPAHRKFSLDVIRKPSLEVDRVPAWMVNIFKLQLGMVYFFAGAAKLNPDWLFSALPLKIWLPAKAHLPVIGWLMEYEATAFMFSWAGAFYDLTIAFFLLYKPTRIPAYISVIVFHLVTYSLFQIGMFPFIMILSTLIFFSPEFHEGVIRRVQSIFSDISKRIGWFKNDEHQPSTGKPILTARAPRWLTMLLIAHFVLQLLLPFRFILYPGNLFWSEQGFRFSWRVMLMEKAGYAVFHVSDPETGRTWEVANWEHLTEVQEKMMATQPDMILQFAHHLEEYYQQKGIDDAAVTAASYVTLNGRRSRLLINPEVDLTKIDRGWAHKDWITEYPENEQSWFGHTSK